MPEHANIQDPDIHEPTGVASADAGQTYVADGVGGGAWIESGGAVFGSMEVISNSDTLALTAASDGTLNTNSEYTKVDSGLWSAGPLSGVTFDSSGFLLVSVTGIYNVIFWGSIEISVINTLSAIKFSMDDTNGTLNSRKLSRLSGASGDRGSMSAAGQVLLTAGDKLSMWAAADKSCNLTIIDGGFDIILLKAS